MRLISSRDSRVMLVLRFTSSAAVIEILQRLLDGTAGITGTPVQPAKWRLESLWTPEASGRMLLCSPLAVGFADHDGGGIPSDQSALSYFVSFLQSAWKREIAGTRDADAPPSRASASAVYGSRAGGALCLFFGTGSGIWLHSRWRANHSCCRDGDSFRLPNRPIVSTLRTRQSSYASSRVLSVRRREAIGHSATPDSGDGLKWKRAPETRTAVGVSSSHHYVHPGSGKNGFYLALWPRVQHQC